MTDPDGRVIVTPTPRGGAAGARAWPGSPAAMIRYVACVVEDGTCANGGVAEIDVSARPRVFVNDVLTTTKGAISEAFRLDARDSDGDSLLYVITSLPADLRGVKGTTRFCADGDPDTLTCKGSPYSLTQSCVGDCLILCSAGAQCVSCVESNQLVCPGSQTPARNPLIYYTANVRGVRRPAGRVDPVQGLRRGAIFNAGFRARRANRLSRQRHPGRDIARRARRFTRTDSRGLRCGVRSGLRGRVRAFVRGIPRAAHRRRRGGVRSE